MESTKQIVPGFNLPDRELIRYAEHQSEYFTLWAWRAPPDQPDGLRVSRWKLSWRERLRVLFGGSIWLSILTFNNPLQPVKLEAKCPISGSAMLDEEVE